VKQTQEMSMGLGLAMEPNMARKGELVLGKIATLKGDLKAALDQVDGLLIHFSEARALDPCFQQTLCQGHRAMEQLKKALLDGGDPTCRGISTRFRHVGCMLHDDDSCLWSDN
jgi:hypothetical protein